MANDFNMVGVKWEYGTDHKTFAVSWDVKAVNASIRW